MLSIGECKNILNQEKEKFTDEEVIKIREYLYKMSDIFIESKKGIEDENA